MSRRIVPLTLLLVVLAVTVVHLRHYSRSLFTELQQLKVERDALNTEWGKLLLEEGAWSQHRRIERTARTRLHMAMPGPEQMIIVYSNGNTERP